MKVFKLAPSRTTKAIRLIFAISIIYLNTSAQVNVVLLRGMGKTSCGESTDLCWSLSKGTQLIGTLQQNAATNLNCHYDFTLSSVAVSVTHWIVISSTFHYEYSECSGTVYALGTGGSREEALNKALTEIGSNNFSWRSTYPYQIILDESITAGGQYDNGHNHNQANNHNANNNSSPSAQLNSLISQLQQQVTAGNTSASQHTQNLIFDLVTNNFPDRMDEIIGRISSILEGHGDNHYNEPVANTNPPQSNAYNSNTSENPNYQEQDYPEGWTYLQEYQQLLNQLINLYNNILAGGDPTAMLNLSDKLQKWTINHQNIFGRFNQAQLKAWEKMLAYFSDMLTKSAEAGINRLENINYIGEAQNKGNSFPNIQTGAIMYNPNESAPAPAGVPNNNGFEKGEFRQDKPGCIGPRY